MMTIPTELSARYKQLPKRWKTERRWFAWQLLRREGKLQLEHMATTGLSYHNAYTKEAAHIVVGEDHAAAAGIGFDFPEEPLLLKLELGHARDPVSGELVPEAQTIITMFPESYAEIGPTGRELFLVAESQHAPIQSRSVTLPRETIRPALTALLDMTLRIERLVGPLALTGMLLSGVSGEAADSTESFGQLLEDYIVPKPRSLTREPWDEVSITLPPAPYLAPDPLPELTARHPVVSQLWNLYPGIVPVTPRGCYGQRLLDYAAEESWPLQAMADLLAALRRKHDYGQLPLDYYQRRVWQAIHRVFDGLPLLQLGGR